MARRERTPTSREPGNLLRLHELREKELEALKILRGTLATLEACEHHFHSVRRQHYCREQLEVAMLPGTLLLQLDYAENVTIPVGPVEEQSWFWATSRLGISTLGIYARFDQAGTSHKRYFHYVSQILDHTALHASEALKDVIQRLMPDLTGIEHIMVWTDCGPHYRAYAFLATAVPLLAQSDRWSSISFNFFGEHHGKGRNDGQFGLQRKWVEAATSRKVISTMEHFIEALQEGAAHTMRTDPPPAGPKYDIVHFHPPKPKKFNYLDAGSMDLKVEYTYCVCFRRTKNKRYPVFLDDYTYSDRFISREKPRELGAPSLIVKDSAEAWRVSYRKDEPEKEGLPETLLRRRLEQQRHARSTEITFRHTSEMEKLLAIEKEKARQKAKARRAQVVFARQSQSDSGASSSSSSSSSSTNNS